MICFSLSGQNNYLYEIGSSQILEQSDEIIRIPMSGFVPSFNLQAPLSYVAIEAQRQRS